MPPADPQLALDFASPAPRVGPCDVVNLCHLLRGQGWLTAAQISARVVERRINGGRPWNERRVRAIAEASDGRVVSFPGSPGYKLFDEVSEAMIDHAIAAIRSQAKRMMARSLAIERRHHRRDLVDRPQPQS